MKKYEEQPQEEESLGFPLYHHFSLVPLELVGRDVVEGFPLAEKASHAIVYMYADARKQFVLEVLGTADKGENGGFHVHALSGVVPRTIKTIPASRGIQLVEGELDELLRAVYADELQKIQESEREFLSDGSLLESMLNEGFHAPRDACHFFQILAVLADSLLWFPVLKEEDMPALLQQGYQRFFPVFTSKKAAGDHSEIELRQARAGDIVSLVGNLSVSVPAMVLNPFNSHPYISAIVLNPFSHAFNVAEEYWNLLGKPSPEFEPVVQHFVSEWEAWFFNRESHPSGGKTKAST